MAGRRRSDLKYKAAFLKDIASRGDYECFVCGSPFVEVHRMVPGSWGGRYEWENVELLCPTHHAMTHFLMRWLHKGGPHSRLQDAQLMACQRDKPLMKFWRHHVRPVVVRQMQKEGRWSLNDVAAAADHYEDYTR